MYVHVPMENFIYEMFYVKLISKRKEEKFVKQVFDDK